MANWDIVKARLSSVGAIVKDIEESKPLQELVHLGIAFNLRSKTFGLSPSWLLKVKELVQHVVGDVLSLGDWWKIFGCLHWAAYVMKAARWQPLSYTHYFHLFAFMRHCAQQLAHGILSWTSRLALPEQVCKEFAHFVALVSNPMPPLSLPPLWSQEPLLPRFALIPRFLICCGGCSFFSTRHN